MKKLAFTILALCTALTFVAKAQHAKKHEEITKNPIKVIFTKTINTPKIKNQEVKMVVVTFAPGEVSGAHRHPIPAIAYVLEGELQSTFEGKTKIFKKGETFYEDPNGLHAETINLSKTKEAKLLVYFIGDKEKPYILPAEK